VYCLCLAMRASVMMVTSDNRAETQGPSTPLGMTEFGKAADRSKTGKTSFRPNLVKPPKPSIFF